jgi:hypothetical protein
VLAFRQQILSATWAPRFSLHFSVLLGVGHADIASLAHSGMSTIHHHLQRMSCDIRTTAGWRRPVPEASGKQGEALRAEAIGPVRQSAAASSRGAVSLPMAGIRGFTAHNLVTIPAARRWTERVPTERVGRRKGAVFRAEVSAPASYRSGAITVHRLTTMLAAGWSSQTLRKEQMVVRSAASSRSLPMASMRPTGTVTGSRPLMSPGALRSIERTVTERLVSPMLRRNRDAFSDPAGGRSREKSLGPVERRFNRGSGTQIQSRVTYRRIELTWRRSNEAPAGTRVSTPTESPFASTASPRRSSPTTASADVVTLSPPAAFSGPLGLDAGQLDRLTDDVIRRVERRVRIARERRGL